MKKLGLLFATVVMIMLFVFSASAATEGDYTYEIENGEVTITYVGKSISGNIVIPSSLGGYPVTTIGDHAFFYQSGPTSITIPNSVTTIGSYAFSHCDNLRSITIPDSVITIGERVFCYSNSLNAITVDNNNKNYSSDDYGVLFNKSKTKLIQYPVGNKRTSYTIPNSVTTIDSHAFYEGYSLSSIVIPNSVTSIGDSAFYYCNRLASISIPNSVTAIGNNAFRNCDKLTSVTIPNGVTIINDYTFSYCDNLKNIVIPNSVTTIGSNAFYESTSLTNIAIPDSVKTIGQCAFYSCDSLTSVTIGDNATTIGYKAFSSCGNLTGVTLGCSVTVIGEGAFEYCDSLTSITIPYSVTTIGEYAFFCCDSLTNIIIPYSVTTIGNYAFTACDSLVSITVDKNNKYYSNDEYGALFNKDKTIFIQYPCGNQRTEYIIPDSVITINNYALDSSINLKVITIGGSVTTIGEFAFCSCDNLISVTFPDSIISIGYRAFDFCYNFTDVYYKGSKAEWRNVDIDDGNDKLTGANIHYGDNINILGREFEENLDYYSEYWNSSNYNAELANMLALASTAVYDENSIRNFYSSLKFDVFELCDYDGVYDPSSCGYAIGFKVSEFNNEIICLIAIRGSSNISDWVGNILLQTNEEEKHIGFASPAVRIYNKISEMMQNNHLSKNIKYVITGHSRGAAVGNLLSVKLIENGVSLSNVYNYNFACPDVACKIAFPYYDNIFNFCNIKDVVPFLPGELANSFVTPGTYWSKYGRTYWFSENPKDENDMFAAHDMKLYLEYFDQKPVLSQLHYDLDTVKDYSDNGIVVKVCCPVDVIVMDTEGNNIASVIDGEINYYDSIFGDVIILTDGDKKVIYVNGDRNFNVNLVGTDDGTMTYSVEKYNLINDNSEEIKSFVNIELQKGKEMYSPVSTAEKTEDIKLFVIEEQNGKEITSYEINADGSETELNHVYKSVINAPTCTGSGFTTYTCSCGDTYTGDTVPANGHTDSEWIVDSDSTCVKEGSKHIECTVCEEVLKTEPIAKLPHNYSSVVTEATCETGGYTTYTCTCGDTYKGDKTPAKGHDYAEGVCRNCGDSKIVNCSCNCHKSGLMGIIWKILRFFYKLFKINPVCGCGVTHY